MKKNIKKIVIALQANFLKFKSQEDLYYEKLFIQNENWNKPEPNIEENLRWEIIKKFIEDFIVPLNYKNIEILDLGCGRGWLTKLLSNYGQVLGVEPVKKVVVYARKMFPKLSFISGTTSDLLKSKDLKKYDLIVASEVIEHIEDSKKKEFVKDVCNLLKDNGFLIITTPRKEAQEEWNFYSSPNQPIEDWISEIELEKIILNQSFTTKQLERLSIMPIPNTKEIEIYQLWLFQKITND